MPEPTKSTQEAGKTPGSTTGSSAGSLGGGAGSGMTGGATGHSTGQPLGGGQASQTTSGSAARQAREHSSSKYDQSGYDQSGSSSTMEREVGEITGQTRRARQSVSDTYHRASHGLNETWEQAMDYSRENPGRSTLIAFGVGVGVGLLMANGFATRSRTRRIVPPVMNALSEIATELFR